MLEAVTAYAASDEVLLGELKYVPYPATWLNKGRYEDDPAEWTANRNSEAAKESEKERQRRETEEWKNGGYAK